MRTRIVLALVFVGCLASLASLLVESRTALGADAPPTMADAEAIRKAVDGYVAAFNKAELDPLMSFWSADPEFIDETGKITRGREAIASLFKRTFEEHKGTSIKITIKAMRFVKPDVAIQDGIVTLSSPDGSSGTGSFTSIWAKNEGKWLLSRVHDLPEDAAVGTVSNMEKLKLLDWLIGEWSSEGKDNLVTFSGKWSKGQTFLVVEQAIHLKDQDVLSLTQIIGWDPAQQQIRSWVFDSRGGFGEGWWTRTGNVWTVECNGVLADGRSASSNSIWKKVDDNNCEWESVDREIDGQRMPDVAVKYVRQAKK